MIGATDQQPQRQHWQNTGIQWFTSSGSHSCESPMILHQHSRLGLIGLLLLLAFLNGCDRTPAPPASKPTVSTPAPQATGLPATAQSFETAKKWLYERVYYDHPKTFYCNCDYSRSPGQPGAINLRSCGLQSRQDPARAQRLEAEHVFPAAQFGNFRRCWREPAQFPDCVRDNSKVLTGRECCQKVDPLFEAAHNDLYNLFPAEGEINGDRRDYNWGMVASSASGDYGRCVFKIDASNRRAEPPDRVKGDIARAMSYMSETYGFNLSSQDRQLFTAWNRQDPPDAWEQTRNQRIAAIQGKDNRFISQYAPRADQPAPVSAPTCGTKTTCKQMSSCDEAQFYLTRCGVKSLDGDGDGIPCVSLCRR
ncbi:MAG: endonuclease [Candidatus Competibacteraceae bacterium]|nr:endonuclease [Candidatus Competibacteraceae bacterium]